jgi:hypothetical protein
MSEVRGPKTERLWNPILSGAISYEGEQPVGGYWLPKNEESYFLYLEYRRTMKKYRRKNERIIT